MLRKIGLLALFMMLFSTTASAKSVYFDGYTSYNRYGNNITLRADYVRNTRNARTGTLKLQLWATRYKYRGGYINGYIVGQSTLGELYANRYYRNVSRTVRFRRPPPGYYYMTLVLAEYRYDGTYKTMDYVNYRRRESF
jgi:hypothetical protein